MAYLEYGDSDTAREYALEAVDDNPHVVSLMLGREPLPIDEPEYVSPGEPSEATVYVLGNLAAWQQCDGALRWLGRLVPATSPRR